eukprot:Em0466g2a
MSPLGLSKLPLEHCCEHLHTRIEELLLDILYSSTKMLEELKKDETESLTDVTMIQLEGLLIGAVITCTVHGNGTGPIILDQPVFTKADQQLLGSSYIRDVTMLCNKPDMLSNLTRAQPLQQAPCEKSTYGSLVPLSISTETVSELSLLQCSH